jgi:hypothetical protein
LTRGWVKSWTAIDDGDYLMDGVTQKKCHALPLCRDRNSPVDAELRRRPARVAIPLLPFAAAAPVLVRRYTTLNRSLLVVHRMLGRGHAE